MRVMQMLSRKLPFWESGTPKSPHAIMSGILNGEVRNGTSPTGSASVQCISPRGPVLRMGLGESCSPLASAAL